MRIEKVVIENINSLFGRFEIDFTDPGYADGLFAIVGSSGAGKTTVLDAISLALYGKTPRIGMISKTQDEIMSRGSSTCRAEAVFSAHKKRYMATFVHKRAKGKNPFADVQREVMEYMSDGSWGIVAAKIREADDAIARITGLDYDQFTRSIMLAQFQFAEFLKADANTRSGILEQITDMDIYRDISIAVFERAKSERETLSALKIRMDAIAVLDDVQQKALEQQLARLDDDIAAHTDFWQRLRDCSDTMNTIGAHTRALGGFEQQKPIIETALAAALARFELAQKTHADKKKAFDALQTTLKSVQKLDGDIAGHDKDIARLNRDTADDTDTISKHKNAILMLFRKHMPDADNARLKSLYAAENITDSIRRDAKTALERAQNDQRTVGKQIDDALKNEDAEYWQTHADMLRIVLPLRKAQETIKKEQENRKTIEERLKKLEAQDKAVTQKAAEVEERYMFAKLQQRFETERGNLEDGKACPLCGAVHHPSADVKTAPGAFAAAEKDMSAVLAEKRKLDTQIIEEKSRIGEMDRFIDQQIKIVQKHEAEFGECGETYGGTSLDAIKAELTDTESIRRVYTMLLGKKATAAETVSVLSARLGDVDKDVQSIDNDKQRIKDAEKKIGERQKQIDETLKGRDESAEKRRVLFGSKDADAEEKAAAVRVRDAGKAVEDCRGGKDKQTLRAAQNKQDVLRTKTAIDDAAQTLKSAYAKTLKMLSQVCGGDGDADEDIQRAFDEMCAAAERLGKDAMDSADALKDTAALAAALLDKEKVAKGAIGQTLKHNESRQKERHTLMQNTKAHEKIAAKWNRLDILIGSSKGDKFSRMAQGITFEVLLGYANNSLGKMSDRYILVRDTAHADKPLEISVVDMYQAGDMRPVSNLSGGESFVVSMALALGLSEMSSNKTRIDSLFIDEGFASLDENYLEAAMQTLSSLGNRDGKLVGVISHVDAIKERIAAKIEVTKLSGGKSTLEGPGVRVVGDVR